ncbi:ribonuclease H protein, partial [Trifolium medium]|nr:ribonuclease H protein [Trifolium medium]
LNGVVFPMLSCDENQMLVRPFQLDEIEKAILESDGSKSPGPDGFNFAFVKAFWNLLKCEVRILFDQFHGTATLPKSFSSYFVTLIPKIVSPFSLGDFRPISLLGRLYKIIAKVLTERLSRVMDSLVETTQSAFIKGRNLVDGVVVVNEVVDMARRTSVSCLILKYVSTSQRESDGRDQYPTRPQARGPFSPFLILVGGGRVSSIPFKYLGLPVGATPVRSPLGNLFSTPFGSGWVCGIPVQVWKKIRRLQREFLWGGRRGNIRIPWVKWEVVCLPKKKGGLGVRDIRVVNISLLAKWRWRLLTNDNAVWKDLVRRKYGDRAVGKVVLDAGCQPWFASLWWKDICSIGCNLNDNWFVTNVAKKLGNGEHTSFWEDTWVGNTLLKDRFPRLYSASIQKEATVGELHTDDAAVHWNLAWRRRFFVWEENQLPHLLDLINPITLTDVADCWVWVPEKNGHFSVKSTFSLVSEVAAVQDAVSPWHGSLFSFIWRCPAPAKVTAFAWQLLHDWIPTRSNLHRRHIIHAVDDCLCVLCGESPESAAHLFLYCKVALKVWKLVFQWLNLYFALPHSLYSILAYLIHTGEKDLRKGMGMIWKAVVWSLWRHRNSVCFEGENSNPEKVFEGVIVSTWKWWLNYSKAASSLLYEWRMQPQLCIWGANGPGYSCYLLFV